MEKRVIFGDVTKKEMMLTTENSGVLLSDTKEAFNAICGIELQNVETVDTKTGEVSTYDVMILKTENGFVRVPNDVAMATIKKFVDLCNENDVKFSAITLQKKERKSASTGQTYLDVDIIDYYEI